METMLCVRTMSLKFPEVALFAARTSEDPPGDVLCRLMYERMKTAVPMYAPIAAVQIRPHRNQNCNHCSRRETITLTSLLSQTFARGFTSLPILACKQPLFFWSDRSNLKGHFAHGHVQMFYVAPSRLAHANDGLFAKRPIKRGTLVRMTTTKAVCAGSDYLNYYIPRDSDEMSPCVVDGRLSTVKEARSVCTKNLSKKTLVRAPADILMKANDLGWDARARMTPHKYQARIHRNAFEFVLSVDREGVNGIYAYFTRDVPMEEEIGSTYGWEYWS